MFEVVKDISTVKNIQLTSNDVVELLHDELKQHSGKYVRVTNEITCSKARLVCSSLTRVFKKHGIKGQVLRKQISANVYQVWVRLT